MALFRYYCLSTLNNQPIPSLETVKYLGLDFDKSLT